MRKCNIFSQYCILIVFSKLYFDFYIDAVFDNFSTNASKLRFEK